AAVGGEAVAQTFDFDSAEVAVLRAEVSQSDAPARLEILDQGLESRRQVARQRRRAEQHLQSCKQRHHRAHDPLLAAHRRMPIYICMNPNIRSRPMLSRRSFLAGSAAAGLGPSGVAHAAPTM